jgi:hypothetical protein
VTKYRRRHSVTWLGYALLIPTLGFPATKNGFDLSDSSVPEIEILDSGTRKDAIPALDQPKFIAAEEADFLKRKDRILGVYHNGIAKAYPIKILDWHEIVNDTYDDEAILVSYCPLCGTGMVFSAQAKDFAITFGVSGLLYNSDVLLYDRPTSSLWSQILGRAVTGPLKNTALKPIPSSHTSWQEWQARHPETLVLSRETGFRRNYRESPYLDYARSGKLMFPVSQKNSAYRNKEMVLGVQLGDHYKAYPFKELKSHGQSRFTDEFAGKLFSIEWLPNDKTARAFDQHGNELPTVLAYWFAWYTFHPDTLIFEATR